MADGIGEFRDEKGRFKEGNPGGPGRPKGVPSLVAEMRKLWADDPARYAVKLDEMLMSGDRTAWQIFMERADPVPKDVNLGVDAEVEVGWKEPKK